MTQVSSSSEVTCLTVAVVAVANIVGGVVFLAIELPLTICLNGSRESSGEVME